MAAECRDFLNDLGPLDAYEIDGSAGQSGQHHGAWVNLLALFRPLDGDGFGEAAARHTKNSFGRRADQPTIKGHAEAVTIHVVLDRDGAEEAFHFCCGHSGSPRLILRWI